MKHNRIDTHDKYANLEVSHFIGDEIGVPRAIVGNGVPTPKGFTATDDLWK